MRAAGPVYMHKSKHNIIWLILGLTLLCVLGWFMSAIPPSGVIPLILFFTLIAGGIFSVSRFLFSNIRHAILVSLGVCIILFLRLLGLRELLYTALLIPVLISVDILTKRSN